MINKITFTGKPEGISKALNVASKKVHEYVGADKVYPNVKQVAKDINEFVSESKIFENDQLEISKKIKTPTDFLKTNNPYSSPYMLTTLKDIRELEAKELYTKSYPLSHGTPENEISGLKVTNHYFA